VSRVTNRAQDAKETMSTSGDQGTLARRLAYVVVALLVANVGALADLVLHPAIAYLDVEHLLVGGLSALTAIAAFVVLELHLVRRERAADEMRRNEYFFRESQRVAHIGSYRADFVADAWKASEVLDEIFGIGPQYLHSYLGWLDLVHPDDRATIQAYREDEVRGQGRPFDREYRIVRKSDGAVRWVHERAEIVRDAAGAVVAMTGTIQDVTGRREAELALQESERRVRMVLETMSLIGLMLDRTGRITLCNDFLLALSGWTRDEVMGQSWFELFVPPEIRKNLEYDVFLKAIDDGALPVQFENEILTRTGERRLIRWSNIVLRDHARRVTGVASIGEDITARRRADLEREVMHEIAQSVATSANLDELLALMHHSLQRVLTADNCFVALHDGRTGLFSFPYFVDQYDTLPEPVAMTHSLTAYVFRHGQPALITPDVFRQLQAQGEADLVGAPSPSWMGVPLRTPSGMIGVLVVQQYEKGVVHDDDDLQFLAAVGNQVALVIERKLAEAALRESEAQLNVILESTADGLLAVDSQGKVLRTNARFAELWRIPPEIIASGDDDRLLHHVLGELADPDEFLAKVKALYNSTAEANDVVHFVDGRVFERYTAPILKGGDHVGRVWSFRDVTARVRAVEERALLEDRLHHAQKLESVGRLAGGIAHDYNNMLGAILVTAELAMEQVDPAHPLHADLAEIRKAAQRSAELTRQLLAYARRQTVAPEVLDLNDTLQKLLSMLQRLIGEDITIIWEPTPNLWPVSMDPSQLANVLTNLCVNARHAIADVGTIALAAANCEVDAAFCAAHADAVPGEYVRLTVRDTGCGMDAATTAMVFEPFFTTKGVGEGTGLGLASVYGAVRQNDGFVTVSSVVGEGTTFEIYLPRQRAAAPAKRASGGVSAIGGRGQETILAVEDEPAIRRLCTRLLEARGYVVLAAAGASEAITLATQHPGEIQLLLTDVVMPEMNGRDLADRLLTLRPGLKQLFMSGHTADVIADRGMLAHDVSFIEKPFSADALVAKVRGVLDEE
jgi:two-component system cell cycle sensor histidine kinase/response regulator CckA